MEYIDILNYFLIIFYDFGGFLMAIFIFLICFKLNFVKCGYFVYFFSAVVFWLNFINNIEAVLFISKF